MAKVSDDTGGLKLISRESGAPAVDLASLTLALSLLDVIPEQVARSREVLPVRVEAERLFVATTRPEDRALVAELAFMTGRNVIAYAAHPEQLRETINQVFDARKRGALLWRGPKAGPARGSVESALRQEPVSPPPPVREPFRGEPAYESTPAPAVARARPSVLVVDDEPIIRRMLKEALAQRGYEAVDAGTGAEAFQLIKERAPDAILLDAMLPDVHGFEICKRLKASRRFSRIPIIMVTAIYKGWRMAADLKESYGVVAVVEKPFDMQRLVVLLGQALAGRAEVERPWGAPLSADAHRLYGEAADAYRRDDLETATRALSAAIQIDPLSATLHHQLGLVHARCARDFAAIEELEAAIDLEPGRYQTLRNLAVLYQKHGFRRKAFEAWERTLSVAPDDATGAEIRRLLLSLI